MASWLQQFRTTTIDLVYPPQCPGCGDWAGEREPLTLCARCQSDLWACEKPCCRVCGESYLPAGTASFQCQTCQGRNFAFEFAVAPYQSRGVLRELIHRLKYQGHLFLRPYLGRLLAEALQDERLQALSPDWCTIPVPLHHRRFREREFNQALELCRELKKRRGIPTLNALKRTRYTSSQTRYQRHQRIANLKDAFAVRWYRARALQDRDVALVDDVFTTGSTAHECARVLRAAGARKVVVITLARG